MNETTGDQLFNRPARSVDRVFLHCSASDDESLTGTILVDTVRRWHLARGFSDIGYHFLVDKAGRIMSGRSLEEKPAAQKGHNTGTIAIMAHGLTSFPGPMLNAVAGLCSSINTAYGGRITFHGHCEVSAKACPVFNYHSLLRLDRFQRMP